MPGIPKEGYAMSEDRLEEIKGYREAMDGVTDDEADWLISELEQSRDVARRLREIILINNLWHDVPCCLCGYSGSGYYNADKHSCVAEVAAIHKKRMEDKDE